MELKNVKDTVKAFLLNRPKTRDSDCVLLAAIWLKHIKADADKMSAADFIMLLENNRLPNFESIRRVRQKLQEQDPNLRGPNYKVRKSEEEKIKQELKEI